MNVKNLYIKYNNYYHKYNLNIVASIFSNLFMAVLNLILIIKGGSKFLIATVLFYLSMSIIRSLSFYLYKKNKSMSLIAKFYAISSTFCYILIPFLLIYILTTKQYKPFIFEWFIYAYAFYATLKIIFAFMHIKKTFNQKDIYLIDIKMSNLVIAFYTLLLMAFYLIHAYGTMDEGMINIMIFLNVLILITALIALIVMYLSIRWAKKND